MIIAVNTRLDKETQPEGYYEFLFALLQHLSGRFPEHQFIYIFDRPYDAGKSFTKNVTAIITGPKAGSILRLQYWFNYRIPSVLRKYKADAFLSLEGICSLRTKVPQCLLLGDLRFLDHPQLLKSSQAKFYQKNTPAFLSKAKNIATLSDYSRSLISDRYKVMAEEMAVIKPVVDEIFRPLNWEEKEIIKEKYADGKAYFLFSGDINQHSNLINLLKAFTFFKKRQKSSMQLLIAGKADQAFKTALKTYKLRNEVKLLEELTKEELSKITAAAYAFVYPVNGTLALPALQAIKCAVPAITAKTDSLCATFGKAVLYTDAENFEDIAEKMMLIFKNETLAAELVKSGNELIKQYDPGKTTDLLMACILKAVNS
ncbi:MAG: glycosyltransferase [Ferruginibacter sp.]|nr:glycosyltransferase [Ferruginibacter sp.]